MTLTQEDITSPTWKKVKEYAQTELAQHRTNLETDASPEKTAKLRGSIRTLNLLLALEQPPAPADDDTDDE